MNTKLMIKQSVLTDGYTCLKYHRKRLRDFLSNNYTQYEDAWRWLQATDYAIEQIEETINQGSNYVESRDSGNGEQARV